MKYTKEKGKEEILKRVGLHGLEEITQMRETKKVERQKTGLNSFFLLFQRERDTHRRSECLAWTGEKKNSLGPLSSTSRAKASVEETFDVVPSPPSTQLFPSFPSGLAGEAKAPEKKSICQNW